MGLSWIGYHEALSASLPPLARVSMGEEHTLGITWDEKVIAWTNYPNVLTYDFGQTQVPAGLTRVVQVAAGSYHNVALQRGMRNDTRLTWLGVTGGALSPSFTVSGTNLRVGPNLVSVEVTAEDGVSTGTYHIMVTRELAVFPLQRPTPYSGRVLAWGSNDYGQAEVPAGLRGVAQVLGGHHSLALRKDGTVLAWGADWYGQAKVPAGLSEVVEVAAGQVHSVALKSNGTVVAWGQNENGQTDVPEPLKKVVQLAAGELHTLALKSDGTVVAWEANWYGEATAGYEPVMFEDMNGDGKPDLILLNTSSGQTGPILPLGYRIAAVDELSGDGKPDLLLWNPANGKTQIRC